MANARDALLRRIDDWWAIRGKRRIGIDPEVESDITSLANLLRATMALLPDDQVGTPE